MTREHTIMTVAPSKPNALVKDQRIVLTDISWDLYNTLRDERANHSVRMTYDRGDLELMSPSSEHETYSRFLNRLLGALSLEFDIPLRAVGSTTWRRDDLQQGQEADEAFYIQHESVVRDRLKLDAQADPPPDLVIEIDISRPSTRRVKLYAALGVAELWRWDRRQLHIQHLHATTYRKAAVSLAFPFVSAAALTDTLGALGATDDNSLIRQFLQRVREQRKTDAG